MSTPRALWFLASFFLAFAAPLAQAGGTTGPAITVLKIGYDGGNTNDFAYYGQAGGIAAYSIATTSCNPGDQQVQWTSTDHPVIGQNIFRLKDGRFEQLGQSWLKHGFCAVNEPDCGTCQTTPCSTLGIGCADTYWATLNDGQGGGPKYQVNATTGLHVHPYPAPTGTSTLRGRLQVLVSEIDPALNPGAAYYAEGQYVSAHTASNGNGSIANSYRKLNVVSVTNIDGGGTTAVNRPAPYAWKAEDPTVTVLDVYNAGEGTGPGARWCIAYKVTDLGGGTWRYDYVVENINSDRSGYSFSVPVAGGANISSPFFRDVEYHSGEPFSNTNWVTEQSGGFYRWRSTQTFAQNTNANALRWGTMYTFSFVSDGAPQNVNAEIAMFKPTGGGSNTILAAVKGPNGCPPPGIATGPQSQDACTGAQVTFSVTPSGTGPFTYQWFKNAAPIPGATGSQHVIPSAGPGDVADYTVAVTNACGTTTSAAASLAVVSGSPSINTQPVSQAVCSGSPVTFTVGASGSGNLTYQWFHGASPIPGQTSTVLFIPSTGPGDAGSYSVQVSNACTTVTSATATLIVAQGPPTVTSDPLDVTDCAGTTASFSVSATGSGTLSYQWYFGASPIPGGTSSTLLVPNIDAGDAGNYTAQVANQCGTDNSVTATLVVHATAPVIDTDPQDATVCQGGDAFFFVDASGPGLAYQWYHGATLLPGATDSSYYVLSAEPSDAGDYSVEVTNTCGTVASAAATLLVLPPGCAAGSSTYEVTGDATGSDWCIRVTHCGATETVVVPGLAPGSSPGDVAEAFAAALQGLSPIGGCVIAAAVESPGSPRFDVQWASGSLILEVGDASCTSFCTVTTMTSCSFNPILSQVEESVLEPGQVLCFCDGGHEAPPCANPGAIGAGCANSSGSGAALTATGSDSVTADDMVLSAAGALQGQPGLFFQGNNAIANGEGVPFGDGHRCCGNAVIRLQIVFAGPGGSAATTVPIAAGGGAAAGDARCYQFWYRDPQSSCVSTFNFTNGYVVSWSL